MQQKADDVFFNDSQPDSEKEIFDVRLHSFSHGGDEDDDGFAYYAPMTKVIEVCIPMFTAVMLEGMAASYSIIGKRVTLIEETVQSLKKAKELTIEDTSSLKTLVAAIFYSGSAPGYGCGKKEEPGNSRYLETAAVEYLRANPSWLGPHGSMLLKAGNPEGEKAVRSLIKTKLDSLRCSTKNRLALSMGWIGGGPKWNLLKLANSLFKSYQLKVTPDRLYRLAWIRGMAVMNEVFKTFSPEDDPDNAQLESNKGFWNEVDQKMDDLIVDYNDGDSRIAVTRVLKSWLQDDRAEYGRFDFDMKVGADSDEASAPARSCS
ncbi:hypothetical protein V8E36_001886 [Tilletia maclaganii]